jgi:hypothetical protein
VVVELWLGTTGLGEATGRPIVSDGSFCSRLEDCFDEDGRIYAELTGK